MGTGRLLARATIGGLFIGHGTQKLFGWFGGPGLAGTAGFFESIGLRPGRRHATAAGLSEAGGGALLAAGLATPLAAAGLSGVMATAIHRVHAKNGPWASNGGFEYNLVLLAALFLIVEGGPGPLSLDSALGIEKRGTGWALAALGAGVAGAAAAHLSAARQPGLQEEADASDAPTAAEAELQAQDAQVETEA